MVVHGIGNLASIIYVAIVGQSVAKGARFFAGIKVSIVDGGVGSRERLERIEGGAKLLVLLIIHNALKTTFRVDRPEGGLQGRELDTSREH